MKLQLDLRQLVTKPLRDGLPLNLKRALSSLPADVREAQKVEGLRFAQTPLVSPLPCEAAELQQAGFLWVQLQAKLGKTLP